MTQLVWYRNDLRIRHSGLQRALGTGEPVCALYLLCETQWDRHGVGQGRRWYVLESLLELGNALGRPGVPLFVLDAGTFENCPDLLAGFVRDNGIRHLHVTRDYPLNEIRRDRAVAERMRDAGVTIHADDASVLVPPATLRTGAGTPYSVFTPYFRAWRKALEQAPPSAVTLPEAGASTEFPGRMLVEKAIGRLSVSESVRAFWRPGERAAREQLSAFVDGELPAYGRQRDFPALEGTSRLSAALSAGTLSPVDAWLAARSRPGEGADTWIAELAWRDFYRQIMAHYPKLSRGEPFRAEGHWLQWSRDDERFRRWCEGRTGYPLVDAAMRQLVHTGWMHNRLRMLVAMFLSKHLWLDWRLGEAFFMEHLVDGDFAANNGGWQWSASTGTDAVPYFRVFSPVRQSRRFDPEGRFIARFVPELAHLDGDAIHEPWKQPLLAPDYPARMVDHAGVKQRVEQNFRAARELARQETE